MSYSKIKPKCCCVQCGKEISINNINKHTEGKSCGLPDRVKIEPPADLKCPYCLKICKDKNSWHNHTQRCSENKDRNYRNGMTGKPAWNRDLTKSDHPSLEKASQTWRENYKEGKIILTGCASPKFHGSEKHIEGCRKGGGFRKNAGRGKKEYVNNIAGKEFLLRSSFEVKVADWLNKREILWEQIGAMKYNLEGKSRNYYPDFFLPEQQVIIETKNDYLMSLQEEKMNAVKMSSQYPIFILTNKDIENLDQSMKKIVG